MDYGFFGQRNVTNSLRHILTNFKDLLCHLGRLAKIDTQANQQRLNRGGSL